MERKESRPFVVKKKPSLGANPVHREARCREKPDPWAQAPGSREEGSEAGEADPREYLGRVVLPEVAAEFHPSEKSLPRRQAILESLPESTDS